MEKHNENYSNAIDILADLILQFSGQLSITKVKSISQEVKDYIRNYIEQIIENEEGMQAEHELTTQLLRTPHYKRIA